MSIYDRILNRAESQQARIKEIRAQFNSAQKPVAVGSQIATAKWTRLVKQRIDAGVPRAQAVREVAMKYPGLREQYIAEYNQQMEKDRQARHAKAVAEGRLVTSPRESRKPTTSNARARFAALVQELVDQGVERHIAASQVNREYPGLREQVLREAN